MTIDEMITQLSGLTTIFNYTPMWNGIKDAGTLDELESAGLIMAFGVMCICIILNMKDLYERKGRDAGILAVNMPVFIRTFAVAIVVLFYGAFSDVLLGIFGVFNDMFFKNSLMQFQADFHFLLASISSQGNAQTPFFFPTLSSSVEVFLFSVSINLIIIIFYIMIIFSPAFIILGLCAGPILIPISIYKGEMSVKWILFLIAAGIFPAFVGIGIQILNSSQFLNAMAASNLSGKMIQVIFLAVTVFVFITAIPAVVAKLFGARPLAVFSLTMAFLSFCVGSFATSLTSVAQGLSFVTSGKRKS